MSKKFIYITLVFCVLTFVFTYNNTYMEFKNRKCVILNKFTTPGTYKHSPQLYLILKEERGLVFDISVSVATFSQHKIGDTIYFDLRDFDIKQTLRQNLIYFFGEVLLAAITIGLVVTVIVNMAFSVHTNDKKKEWQR